MFGILFVDSVCFYVYEAKYVTATQCQSRILNCPLMVKPQSTKPSTKLVVIVNARNQCLDLNLMGKKKIKI